MKHILLIITVLALANPTLAELGKLYTAPDPSATGGIQAKIASPMLPIVRVLAIPPDEPRFVYKGIVVGQDRRSFLFERLPMRKYDIIVIYETRFYEGLRLHRGESTLTAKDRSQIKKIVKASEPFFTKKYVHRIEGATGRGNFARCITTFLRDRPSYDHQDYRRTFKLVMLKNVGPGWQVVRARDLYPLYVEPALARPSHHRAAALSGIRVAGTIKDLGEINLTR